MTSSWTTIERPRVIDREAATALVGPAVPTVTAATSLLTEPTVVADADTGEPVLGTLPLTAEWTARLSDAVLRVSGYTGVNRAGGLRSKAQTFGMAPRRPVMQRDSCRITQFARDNPELHLVFEHLAGELAAMLRGFAPEVEARDRALIDANIGEEWRLGDAALWTSGVVNHTAQLPYHRDGMNFDAWSAMPVIRAGVSGGALHVPEYGIAPACRNGYVVFFNGHQLVPTSTSSTSRRPSRHAA